MLRRVLQVLAVCSALLFLGAVMIALGFGPFGGTKVRRLFGASAEALAGENSASLRSRDKTVTTFNRLETVPAPVAAAAPELDAGTAAVDAGTAAVDAGRPRMLMPATKSMGAMGFDFGEPGLAEGIEVMEAREPAVQPDAEAVEPSPAQAADTP